MKKSVLLFVILACISLGACSNDDTPPKAKENVFKEQTDAMEKAKQVENVIQQSADQQQQQIDAESK